VGFAPEIISLAEQDWQEVRAEYVSNLKSENVQEDEEDEKELDETVNLAKELFGEKVVEIND
ncbi:DNA polymerase III subunit gamma/tau, partial [Bacillus thuringiensis]